MTKVDDLEARINTIDSRVAGLDVSNSYFNARMQRTEDKLDDLSKRIYVLEERVSHLPTKEFIVKTAIGVVTLIGLLIGVQSKIQAWVNPAVSASHNNKAS